MPQLTAAQIREANKKGKRIGVSVKRSTIKSKKLDVMKNGVRVASIGDVRYSDFLQHGDPERRRRYKLRHQKYRNRVGTPSYYADNILW
jgi:hypothetical protein